MGVIKTEAKYRLQVVDAIIYSLFQPELKRIDTFIENMIKKNEVVLKTQLDGFIYAGKHYRKKDHFGNLTKTSLDMSLWPEMDAHIIDVKNICDDRDKIKIVLNKLYYNRPDYQGYRDATPECLVNFIDPQISKIPRIDQPTTFLENDRDLKLYKKVLPKMEYYAISGMLY